MQLVAREPQAVNSNKQWNVNKINSESEKKN